MSPNAIGKYIELEARMFKFIQVLPHLVMSLWVILKKFRS